MNTETYKTKMQEALNALEKAKEKVRKAEEDARNLYDKQAQELTEKYSYLVGKMVECGGVVGYFRGFMNFYQSNSHLSCWGTSDFYPAIMKPKKDGSESKNMFTKYSTERFKENEEWIKEYTAK